MSKIRIFLAVICLITMMGFFLPWVRPISEDLAKDPLRMKEKLLADSKNFWLDGIWIRARDQEDLSLTEPEAVSGYQIFMAQETKSRIGRLAQTFAQYIVGTDQLDWRIRLVILPFTFALITLWLLMLYYVQNRWLIILGSLQLILYFFARWLLVEGNLLHLELCLAPGIWLTLHGTLLLAISNFLLCFEKN